MVEGFWPVALPNPRKRPPVVEVVLTQASTLKAPDGVALLFAVIEAIVKLIARLGDSEVRAPVWFCA